MNLIVLVVDGLSASYLGPYGNTWCDTPEANALASGGLVLEYAMAATPVLEACYRSYWYGLHPLDPRPAARPSLAAAAGEAGVRSALVTDDRQVAGFHGASEFDQRIRVTERRRAAAAPSVPETQLAGVFDRALDWLATAAPPFLLWVHATGLRGLWDAPYDMRRSFKDDEDPDPPRLVRPPRLALAGDVDPDLLLGLSFAYAAQVQALDQCLGAILSAVDALDHSGRSTSLVLTAPRGFPLGHHGTVGLDDRLYGDLVHVPWIMRAPQLGTDCLRSHALVQPPDVHATALDLVGQPCAGGWGHSVLVLGEPNDWPHRRACAVADGQRAMRTAEWYMRSAGDTVELYAKPDDRYEVNEVSDRCPEVVAEFETQWAEFQRELDAAER